MNIFESLLNEKQIQPSKGKNEGQILLIGGAPGVGKNWVLNNLTDVRNRYKVFDIDEIKELLGSTRNSVIEDKLIEFIGRLGDVDENTKQEAIANVKENGFWGLLTSSTHNSDFIHEFLTETGLFTNRIRKFLLSVRGGVKPNIAFNTTMQNITFSKYFADLLEKIGYDVGNVEVLWVVAPASQISAQITQRDSRRRTDRGYATRAKNNTIRNMLDILQKKSVLTPHVERMYIVLNDKSNVEYYDDTEVVKNFKYFNVNPDNQNNVRNAMRKLLRDRYI